ncbi:MAG: hypothetical protein ABGX16_22350 [Pirellulales bacterium]
MLPGALLGLVLCLGSGRLDWHRRAAVVGLFAAFDWAWGGSISYVEQTFYVLSDSFPDVLYGYTVLFFISAWWAGCGGALLDLGLTEPRSELESLTRPFTVVCAVFVITVALSWMNFRRHAERVLKNELRTDENAMLGFWATSSSPTTISRRAIVYLLAPAQGK